MLKTNIALRNKVIYQVFIRNHTLEGTIQALIQDLDRIKELGVDMVYVLPVHPIGELKRKGSMGSPYSIQDYRQISPDLGTMADFQTLIHEVHKRNMQFMMDIVFNHTSRDSVLLKSHPEWFYKNIHGQFANRVGDWWDITDLDFRKSKDLWVELIDILEFYAIQGVDAFRCDVASIVPLEFWALARKRVSRINKNIIWLSESVHGGFVKYLRDQGIDAWSEAEMYSVFDMAYDYDVFPYLEDAIAGKRPFKDYLEALHRQLEIYPANYVKMKYVENHDVERIMTLTNNNIYKSMNWIACSYFQKGAMMLYAGTEYLSNIRPNLFEKDVFTKEVDISSLISKLSKIKKKSIFSQSIYEVHIPVIEGVIYLSHRLGNKEWHGIFNVGQVTGQIQVKLPDGVYMNQLNKKRIHVQDSSIDCGKDPIYIEVKNSKRAR
ncbi:MAG: alpha-amylase family glycosyl hydrolase [bacterium]|nr:alpha-amylase family glycosyl hydrolase [bacterium]